MGGPQGTLEERFWRFVSFRSTDGCWIWNGATDPHGYGRIMDSENRRTIQAHRLSYKLHISDIPVGLELDHLCRNPSCVNPLHLEAVSHKENCFRGVGVIGLLKEAKARVRRITHCPKGHEYINNNTYIRNGHRYCRACLYIKKTKRRAERRRLGLKVT